MDHQTPRRLTLSEPKQEAFKSIVDKFTPTNWKQQCRANKTAPVFPEKEEPAGTY